MSSSYLSAFEAQALGFKATLLQLQTASATIDSYLSRPEGLIYAPDAGGSPCYMAGLNPTSALTLAGPIEPGLNVTATLNGYVTPDIIGEVVIADRASPSATEALVITSVSGQTVTFSRVGFPHATNAILEAGLVITEEQRLPAKRSLARLARSPVRLLSGMGRYSYGRRSQQASGQFPDFALLATLQQLGPFNWLPFDVTQTSVSQVTGEVWIPAGIYMAYFSEVRIKYVSGYLASAVPAQIKQACANISQAIDQSPGLGPVKTYKSGNTSITMFADTMINGNVRAMLEPFKARLFV